MNQINIDTRNYDRAALAETLIDAACASGTENVIAAQVVKFCDESIEIIDFDGAVMSAGRWTDDIARAL